MADTATTTINRPAWVDLSTTEPAAAREFYGRLFGWDVDVNDDPQYGGYALARLGGKDVAGIGGTQSPDQPAAWSVYIGTDDAEVLSRRVGEAGGTVVAPPFDVGDRGRIAVFRDPSGAFISAWEAAAMGGFETVGANAFGWAELNARGVASALPFYERVFGWRPVTMGDGPGAYTEFHLDEESIAGATEMNPMVPAEVPSYWMVYFSVDDVDSAHRMAVELGGRELVAPLDFPGGRLAVVADPQGASFGLMSLHA
jgi:uncharacterized protein